MTVATITWLKPRQNATTLLDAVKFIKAANADPRLRQTDKTVLSILALKHYNFKTGRLDPAMGTIAKGAGVSLRHAARSVERLREIGYLGIASGRAAGRPNSYRIHWGVGHGCPTGVGHGCPTNLRRGNERRAGVEKECRGSGGGAE